MQSCLGECACGGRGGGGGGGGQQIPGCKGCFFSRRRVV